MAGAWGVAEPLRFDNTTRVLISFLYCNALIFGYVSTVFIARWMARTYGVAGVPTESLFAFFALVAAPLSIASLALLYPSVFFNVLVLIPSIIWSMNLHYHGLPVLMGIPPERGLLMSSSLVGWLLVAFVRMLGLTMGLWANGLGPNLGV